MRYVTTTKNLFGYSSINIANDMANGTIIESLPNGAIVQGDAGANPGDSSYSNGWFRPGYSSTNPVIKAHLLAGDTVTVSCDYLILERSYSTLTNVGIYLRDDTHAFTDVGIYNLEVGKLYRLTATYTVDTESDYYPIFTINSNKTKITNIQIEKGSTATPYVPYGYLPMYKGRYKVSDICQLLDKSKFLDNDGYINNGNGTITTKSIPQDYMRFYDDFDIDGSVPTPKKLSIAYRTYGHKVLILDSGNNSPDGGLKWEINSTALNAGASFAGQGEIFTNNKLPLKDIIRSYFYIVNPSGYAFTCAPQLFDLTEMFGAGNEPTTVAEFKQKLPDDVYPYSPYCWAKIKSLIYKDNIDYIKMK